MNTICWMTSRPMTTTDKAVTASLKLKGYHVMVMEDLPGTDPLVGPSLVDAVTDSVCSILLVSDSTSWISSKVQSIRSLKVPTNLVPIVWLYEEAWKSKLGDAIHSGVDDFLPLSTDIEETLVRIQLRFREYSQLIDSDRQLKEHEIRMAKAETTMKQREEFLGVCAHDLRSPLGLIQSSIGMVLNAPSSALTPLHAELLTRAKRQAGHAINLVNDLLDVMSFEQGLKPQYHVLKLDDFLKDFIKDYGLQAQQKGVTVHYENPFPSWRILADGDRIRQLFQNIFTNAIKFTDPGRSVYLKVTSFVGRRRSDPPFPMVVISLKDEGKGIPQAETQKIFDKFAQLKNSARNEGRGLGLTVAKQISNLHDGNIWVQSVEGEGSTFFVLFPHVISREKSEDWASSKKVLVAEPSFQRRDEYYSQLEQWGYKATFARDGVDALTLAFHHLPRAIVLSTGLEKFDEVELINVLKSDPLTVDIPLLMATDGGQKLQKKHENLPCNHWMKLPVTRETFEAMIAPAEPTRKAA